MSVYDADMRQSETKLETQVYFLTLTVSDKVGSADRALDRCCRRQ